MQEWTFLFALVWLFSASCLSWHRSGLLDPLRRQFGFQMIPIDGVGNRLMFRTRYHKPRGW